MDYQPEGQIPVAQASYTLTKEEYQKGRLLVEKRHASLLSAPVFYPVGPCPVCFGRHLLLL